MDREKANKWKLFPIESARTPVFASFWFRPCTSWIRKMGALAWRLARSIFGRNPQPVVQRTSSLPKTKGKQEIRPANARVVKDQKYYKGRSERIRNNELNMLRALMNQKTADRRYPEDQDSVLGKTNIKKNGRQKVSDGLSTKAKIDRVEAYMSASWWGDNEVRRPFMRSLADTLSNFDQTGSSEFDLQPTEMTSQFVEAAASRNLQLQEASISFAFGDDSAAERMLLDALGSETEAHQITIWLALLELYRTTGQRDKYEHRALCLAIKFERSAPQWLPISESEHVAPDLALSATSWSCPSLLDRRAFSNMVTKLERATLPWRLDWRALQRIDGDVVDQLSSLFAEWAGKPIQLCFVGGAQLRTVLFNSTPFLVRDVAPHWWQLRMQALSLMGLLADLERVALDFCMTYDISPDSIKIANCRYVEVESLTDPVSYHPPGSVESIGMDSTTFYLADENSEMCQECIAELADCVGDGANLLLSKLDFKWAYADHVVVSCRRLVRADFSTAGNLLNWVILKSEANCQVHLVDVNLLVYEFLHVIGVARYATMSTDFPLKSGVRRREDDHGAAGPFHPSLPHRGGG